MSTTRGKDSSNLGKEKKVVSTTNSRNTATKSRAKTSTAASSTLQGDYSSAADKSVPNYLRPTICSRNESFKYVKKTCPEDATQQKPHLERRRSFEKPPSAAKLHSALASTGPQERTVTVRSTSFTPRSTTCSLKPPVERTSKTTKLAGRPQTSYVRTTSKNTNPAAKKVETDASASTKAPKDVDCTETSSVGTIPEDGEFLVHEAEEIGKVEADEVENPTEVQKYEHGGHWDVVGGDQVNHHGEDHHEMLKPCGIPDVSEEIRANPTAQIEEAGDKLQELENSENQSKEEESVGDKDELSESRQEESVASEEKVEVKEQKVEESAADEDSGDYDKTEDNRVAEKEAVDGGNEGLDSKDGQDVEGGVDETKPEEPNTASSTRQVGPGKRDSQANNDVIEETASKLLQKRKNKVKALVGAFETVIDKEASSK